VSKKHTYTNINTAVFCEESIMRCLTQNIMDFWTFTSDCAEEILCTSQEILWTFWWSV